MARRQQLDEYEVPAAIKTLYASNFKRTDAYGPEEEALLAVVTKTKKHGSPLTVANYSEQLKLLNQIEDEHMAKEFGENVVVGPDIENCKDLFYPDAGGFMCQIAKSQLGNCKANVKEDGGVRFTMESYGGNTWKFTGTVDTVDADNVIIYTEKEFDLSRVSKVEFLVERTTFQMEYRALELLEQSVVEKVLFANSYTGNKSLEFSSFEWFRPSVASNPEQAQAIRNIVNQTSFPAPYVLFGPPGTGKTSTLAEAIGQIYKLRPSANVLAVATSNSAANELTSRLLEIIPEEDIYRFFARSCARKKRDIEKEVLEVSNLRGAVLDSNRFYEKIRPCRVVLCTASTAGRLITMDIPKEHFSYIFIDECGSAKEISSLVPIVGTGVYGSEITASIVLTGDPKQLGPVIPCTYLNDTTHSVSLLERIADKGLYAKDPTTNEYDPLVITQLRNNFRSHPALLEYPNRTFYAGKLRAKASTDKTHWAVGWDRLPNRSFPLIFHPVVGEIKQDQNSSSMYNELEAEQILSYIESIINDGINDKKFKKTSMPIDKTEEKDDKNDNKLEQSSIGIITPYARQVRLLKELLNKRGWSEIEVGSTEQYQGREKPIMLMSTVRTGSKSVGFLADTKRLNVSLTRAQALMIVVGDPETLRNNYHWNKFIQYCARNSAIIGCTEKPERKREGPPKRDWNKDGQRTFHNRAPNRGGNSSRARQVRPDEVLKVDDGAYSKPERKREGLPKRDWNKAGSSTFHNRAPNRGGNPSRARQIRPEERDLACRMERLKVDDGACSKPERDVPPKQDCNKGPRTFHNRASNRGGYPSRARQVRSDELLKVGDGACSKPVRERDGPSKRDWNNGPRTFYRRSPNRGGNHSRARQVTPEERDLACGMERLKVDDSTCS